MARPLRIYTFLPIGGNASYYYRISLPLRTASDLGLPVQVIFDTNVEGVNPEHRVRNFCEADVVILYQPLGDGTLHNMHMAKGILPSKRDDEDNGWKYPPTLVMDTDDNLLNVNPCNPAFKNLGVHDPQGKQIPAGSVVGDLQHGKRLVMWHDGPCTVRSCGVDADNPDCPKRVSLTQNRKTLDTYRELLNAVDVVTCSTERVVEYVTKGATPRRTRVLPNLVRFDHYPQIDLAPRNGRVNILWQGGQNHYDDWYPLRESLGEITKKYPQVHWIMWGVVYNWVTELIPPDRMTFLPWAPYEEYKLRRVMIGDDINLAPLQDNVFNRCRTAIKWYEGSVLKQPSATLAQDTGPYHDEIEDGQTGLLFNTPEEFTDKLSLLIEDSTLRRSLAANARDWVSENRDAMKHVPGYIAYLQELRAAAPIEQPHMPEAAFDKMVADIQAAETAKREQEKGATDGVLQPVQQVTN